MTTKNEQIAEVEYWFKEKGEVIHGARRDVEEQLQITELTISLNSGETDFLD